MQLPVEAVDHIPDGADQVLVLLWVGQNDAVKPLHVGVDGIECGRLATACRHRGKKDSQEKGFLSELWKCVCVCERLTGQGDGREAVCEGRAQGVQVLQQEAVSRAFLLHVSFQTLHSGAHALHMFLQRRVTLLILHIGLSQLPQFSLTRYNTHNQRTCITPLHTDSHIQQTLLSPLL